MSSFSHIRIMKLGCIIDNGQTLLLGRNFKLFVIMHSKKN